MNKNREYDTPQVAAEDYNEAFAYALNSEGVVSNQILLLQDQIRALAKESWEASLNCANTARSPQERKIALHCLAKANKHLAFRNL